MHDHGLVDSASHWPLPLSAQLENAALQIAIAMQRMDAHRHGWQACWHSWSSGWRHGSWRGGLPAFPLALLDEL